MSRADEVAQGLRHESGCLTFTLVAEEYSQGHIDFDAGASPPRVTTPSYDLGRARAARLAEESEEVMRSINAEQARSTQAVREILLEAGRPDLLAEMDRTLAEIVRPSYAPETV